MVFQGFNLIREQLQIKQFIEKVVATVSETKINVYSAPPFTSCYLMACATRWQS